jgi:hypothetical protein
MSYQHGVAARQLAVGGDEQARVLIPDSDGDSKPRLVE